MRKNFPITNIETAVREDQYLISKTDLKGRILYANPAFVEISGFSREELIGKAHNIIRHPDMPPEAFADLWETLKANKPWLGVVKNRRKDGGYYWVLANAYPVWENGEVTCYASVRIKPTEEQVRAAEQFYADINEGKVRGYTVKAGQKVPRGWRRLPGLLARPFSDSLHGSMFRMTCLGLAATAGTAYLALAKDVPQVWQWGIWSAIGVATAAMLGYGWTISQRIVKALDGAARVARQIAAGNLTSETEMGKSEEVNNLNFYLDIMRKSLISIGNDVQAGVNATGHTAQVLFNNNTHLSTRTEDQAASLQETAAAMEEVTVTVKQNSDNARAAAGLADESMQIAQRGGTVVSEVVTTMDGIRDSSRRISDIVSLIEGIAFQTNILALNAAVESARAGEAGKSFAVVAGEVRNLALKSSQAAKEVKTLIDDTTARISAGSDQAARAGATMQEIVDSVRRVTDIMGEISTASVEQASAMEQINQAIGQMDGATQQNANLVQDLSSTVRTLSAEADNLGEAIGVLNTGLRSISRPASLSATSAQAGSRPPSAPGTPASPKAVPGSKPRKALAA